MMFSGQAWTLDASALIEMKQIIRLAEQWSFFRCLEQKVSEGVVFFPRMVMNELGRVRHPDVPGAWAFGCRRIEQQGFEPEEEFVRQVMAAAGDVVDPADPDSDADPYVLAQALQLRQLGHAVTVVTRDRRNYGDHISIVEACRRDGIDLPSCSTREFIDQIDCDAGKLIPEN